MRAIPSLTMALLAGCAIGAVAMTALHAQATPPAYSIVEVDVIDAEGFKAFAERNAAGVAAAGGQFIVRRGRVVTSEGTPPKGVFIIAWGSLDKATGYFTSPAFKELIPLRDKAARVRLFHVEGVAR
ncbi:MAG TPA: DUF1330 domain-containing protein [Hyphomicrobiaceae bacterium]|nr:DUF1330 domain-containing protein [Hyphomicrobiaceae bacterium]